MSSTNCCDCWTVHLFLRKADGTFSARRGVKFQNAGASPTLTLGRSHHQPHLLDWNRDGRTDLVLGDPLSWSLRVGTGPLKSESKVEVKPFPLPELPDINPYDFQFADWDGDGSVDVLMAGSYRQSDKGPWLYDIFWLRNVSRRGEPKFGPPVRLLTAPAQSEGWRHDGFAVVDRGRPGRQDLVVSVSKDWTCKPEGGWACKSRLMLYRRKAEPDGVLSSGSF